MLTKKVFSWATYDLANTSFSALIVTVFFPLIIKEFLGGNEFQIGLVMGLSLFLSALLVPLLGGLSDALKVKKPFIVIFTLFTIIATILIAYSNLWFALLFGLLANLFYHASLDIYDSMLDDITDKKHLGKVSGIGTAFGYVGTILSLLLAAYFLNNFGWETEIGTRIMFPLAGIFFFIFAIPLFLNYKEEHKKRMSLGKGIKKSFKEVRKTIKGIRKYKNVWLFLLASLIYVDSLNTVIIFLFLFGKETLGLTVKAFFPIFGIMALAAIVGSLVFGWLSDHVGPKKSLVSALIIWVFVILLVIIKTNYVTYLLAGIIGGALLGAIWTTTRPLLIKIAPKHKLTELFGFQGLTEKLGGIIGPVVFGALVVAFSYTAALISVLVMFVIGLAVLLKVDA
ncbi:MFS transporter [Candidatus Woesearchaeota archaeon]|jgi:MFS transporter, UMF1 family|nr:MFS transporter [Candidatus Woesearchaeota archaeon]MBT4368361.1 MFS transporter [Candidatus Woesearchaeota archaeon]MBT4712850.1 MFS transporter [Candidatus Woesearchaeota archaeon]MBT6639762.1 MFS transporter [Candidatus Woesearchaeota archaeon]MBT7133934.1 MFS transporter [Candidatus Woesearchaeota archaeon]